MCALRTDAAGLRARRLQPAAPALPGVRPAHRAVVPAMPAVPEEAGVDAAQLGLPSRWVLPAQRAGGAPAHPTPAWLQPAGQLPPLYEPPQAVVDSPSCQENVCNHPENPPPQSRQHLHHPHPHAYTHTRIRARMAAYTLAWRVCGHAGTHGAPGGHQGPHLTPPPHHPACPVEQCGSHSRCCSLSHSGWCGAPSPTRSSWRYRCPSSACTCSWATGGM